MERHQSQRDDEHSSQTHEINSLKIFAESLFNAGVSIKQLDGFFFGFCIPQIGKEFDLLKITDANCLNIELKSTAVSEDRIQNQLIKNHHYLSHLDKKTTLYSVITDTLDCYRLTDNSELESVDFSAIVEEVDNMPTNFLSGIENLFRPADFLVSPLNTPQKFINGEYFLSNHQEQIKQGILSDVDKSNGAMFFHLTGMPGTGKTLLLYDIAKSLSVRGAVIVIHCAKLSDGHELLSDKIENLNIVSANELRTHGFSISNYKYILVDESQRIFPNQFERICDDVTKNNHVCIFSTDPGQILSTKEKTNDICGKIKSLDLSGEYELSDKIRTNPELQSFFLKMTNLMHRPKRKMRFPNVDIVYATTVEEANNLVSLYRGKGFVFINFSKSNRFYSPYSQYKEDFDTHHVIGQEFDNVLIVLDDSFYYDSNGVLKAVRHPNPDYIYEQLLYQGVTRVREKLALLIVDAPELLNGILSIVRPEETSIQK